MTDLPFRDLAKLQEQRFKAFETKKDVIDRVLLRNFKAAYEETVGQMAKLYAKVGQENAKDGYYIHKEDAIRYNQFNNRLDNLKAEIETLRKKGVKLTEENSAQSVQDAYYGGQWAFEQAVSVPLPIPALPIAAIRAAVYSDVSGLDLVKTWAKNSTDMYYKTQSAMMRGLTQGYSYTKMARAIKSEFDRGLWQAQRVVRTEAGRCYSVGAEEAHGQALEAGLDVVKRWSATLDKRTRPDHGHMDGVEADAEGLFWLSGEGKPQPRMFSDPAQSIHCRCSTVDILDGISPEVRRIRDEGIVPYVKFDEWAEAKGYDPVKGWPKGVK
jgi:hypothetical protein